MNTICAPRLGFPVPIGLGFPAGQMHAAIMNARRGPLRSPSRPDLCPWHVSPMPRPAVGAAGAGGSGEKKPPKTWKPNFNEKLVSSVQRKQSKGLPPAAIAAMALAPLAALAYQFSKSPEWQKALEQFAARLLMSASHWVRSDDFKEMATRADEGLTYMDWTAGSLGIDLSRVWDPELYVKLKQAAAADQPAMFWNAVYDRIKYVAKIPQSVMNGDARISYAKFLQLLHQHRVKRLVVLGDLTTALVEVPHPWTASIVGAPGAYPYYTDSYGRPLSLLQPNPDAPDDPSQAYCPEMPEWNMEKYRFYVDLPGDFWERGPLLDYLRSRQVSVSWDAGGRQYVMPFRGLTKVMEVKTELQMVHPRESWDFLGWLLNDGKITLFEKLVTYALLARGLLIALNLGSATGLGLLINKVKAVAAKLKPKGLGKGDGAAVKKKKESREQWRNRMTKATAKEFKKGEGAAVRFADIVGIEGIKYEMQEVVAMMNVNHPLHDAYVKAGAQPPRGILFQGPPGTGKTYMARAIATEAELPFFAAVGSEFVEMFLGIASARVNDLYARARDKARTDGGCIVFIDEIDAIGRARSLGGSGDPGSSERESALLAMLVNMDGIHGKAERVLTIGATNLASTLDAALLRPGRFEQVYEIGTPTPDARLSILKKYAEGKKVEGGAEGTLLFKVAEMTQGWSAASLANLMNEAAILQVRLDAPQITLPMVEKLLEESTYGSAGGAERIPPSDAKSRLALVTASKAVALALTPGLTTIEAVTLWSKQPGVGPRVTFLPAVKEVLRDEAWHPEMLELMDWATNVKTNAATTGDTRLGEFLHVASLLLPLYAPRAFEVMAFGKDGASLVTAPAIADCFEIAYYCVRNSMLHPRFRGLPPLHTYIWMGADASGRNARDPLARGLDEELGYHKLTLTLLKAAWRRAQRLVATRRTAIARVADALLLADDETVSGEQLVKLIEETPEDEAPAGLEVDADFMPILREVLGKRVPKEVVQGVRDSVDVDVAPAAAAATAAAASGDAASAALPGATTASASFSGRGAGGVGQASFDRPPASAFAAGASSSSSSSERAAADAVAAAAAAAAAAVPAGVNIKLDEATMEAVARAVVGRLDIVDLIGRSTAYELAERVVDTLTGDPAEVERLKAVRAWVEQEDAPFPPPPLPAMVPQPVDNRLDRYLEWWKQRKINVITWSAIDMLYTERQLQYYAQDMDVSDAFRELVGGWATAQAPMGAPPPAAAAAATAAGTPPSPDGGSSR